MIFSTLRILTVLLFRFLGYIAFIFSKRRKPVAIANVNLCFSQKVFSVKRRNERIVKESFISLAHALADFLLLSFYTKKNIAKYVTIEGLDFFYEANKKGNGVIIVTAHFGSWELAAHVLALKGIKSLVLYNPIKGKRFLWLERLIKSKRQQSGNILITKQNSLIHVYKQLRRGGNVIFIVDQHCVPSQAVKTKLFGQDVWSHKAFAELSLKTGSPVVPGFLFTKSLSKYVLKIYKPIWPQDFLSFENPEKEIVVSSNKILENAVLQSPGQWMWQHRRFKSI